MDHIDKIIAYESGELSDLEIIEFFQELIDSGLVWQLQGSYGHTAKVLIERGYCRPANVVDAVASDVEEPRLLGSGE